MSATLVHRGPARLERPPRRRPVRTGRAPALDHRPGDRRPADRNEDGTVVVVQSGELHNYRELRAERRHGYSRPEAVTRLLDDHVGGRADLSRQLWGLLAFTLWHEHHVACTPGALREPRLAQLVG